MIPTHFNLSSWHLRRNSFESKHGYYTRQAGERYPIPTFFSPSMEISSPFLDVLKEYKIFVNRQEALILSKISTFFKEAFREQIHTKQILLQTSIEFEENFQVELATNFIVKSTTILNDYKSWIIRNGDIHNEFYLDYRTLVHYIRNLDTATSFSLMTLMYIMKVKSVLCHFLDIKIEKGKQLLFLSTNDVYRDIYDSRILTYEIAHSTDYPEKNEEVQEALSYFRRHILSYENRFSVHNCFNEIELFLVIHKGFSEGVFHFFIGSIFHLQKLQSCFKNKNLFIEKYNVLHRFLEDLYYLLHFMARKFQVKKEENKYENTLTIMEDIKQSFIQLNCL